jgi:hypothetical protein
MSHAPSSVGDVTTRRSACSSMRERERMSALDDLDWNAIANKVYEKHHA